MYQALLALPYGTASNEKLGRALGTRLIPYLTTRRTTHRRLEFQYFHHLVKITITIKAQQKCNRY